VAGVAQSGCGQSDNAHNIDVTDRISASKITESVGRDRAAADRDDDRRCKTRNGCFSTTIVETGFRRPRCRRRGADVIEDLLSGAISVGIFAVAS